MKAHADNLRTISLSFILCRPAPSPLQIEWNKGGRERFLFYEDSACLIHHAGELSIVEYGRSEVLATCRTEHTGRSLVSLRINEARGQQGEEIKRLACLMDLQTIRVVDLVSNDTLATIAHDYRIDWLELNAKGTHLLFRDKKHRLHLYDIRRQDRTTLLPMCGYVQWVPDSDVVVAQSRQNLVVWYSVHAPDKQKIFPIKGDVVDIERSPGRTEVLVQEDVSVSPRGEGERTERYRLSTLPGNEISTRFIYVNIHNPTCSVRTQLLLRVPAQTVSYALDENMISLDSALEEGDLRRAAAILMPQELTSETEARWHQLAERSLDCLDLAVAEQCYAAIGDISRARFVHGLIELAEAAGGVDSYAVRARLAVLRKQWHIAEGLMLQQGLVDDVIKYVPVSVSLNRFSHLFYKLVYAPVLGLVH